MDYEKKAMQIGYDILSKEDFEWSAEFDHEMKVDTLKMLIDYFNSNDLYDQSSHLNMILSSLEKNNEVNFKEASEE